jgi:hypothetical protein
MVTPDNSNGSGEMNNNNNNNNNNEEIRSVIAVQDDTSQHDARQLNSTGGRNISSIRPANSTTIRKLEDIDRGKLMKSFDGTLRSQPFDGDENKWPEWKLKLDANLKYHRLLNFIKGDETYPDGDADAIGVWNELNTDLHCILTLLTQGKALKYVQTMRMMP